MFRSVAGAYCYQCGGQYSDPDNDPAQLHDLMGRASHREGADAPRACLIRRMAGESGSGVRLPASRRRLWSLPRGSPGW